MKFQVGEFLHRLIAPIFSSAPSSRQTGEIWYESTANKFKGQKSSGPVDLEGAAGGSLSYSSVTSNQSVAVGTFYGVDCTLGNIVLTLTNGSNQGENLSIKKLDSTDNTVTINNANIDGETSIELSFEDESIDLFWTGSQYIIR